MPKTSTPRASVRAGAAAATATAATIATLALAAPPAAADAGWRWPLASPHPVVRGFEPPPHPWLPGHRGVDLAGRRGAPVVAAGAGVVRFAGVVADVPVVSVAHAGGLLTTYEPVRAAVRRGQTVAAGDALGRLVTRGGHCPPQACLHWGLRDRTGAYLDPLALVGAARVRLLPMAGRPAAGWLVPAVSGTSVGASSTVVTWAVVTGRRRRRRLPPDVGCLRTARARRAAAVSGRRPP